MRIWVDADACPVKNEIERLAARRGLDVIHVCAHEAMTREGPGVSIEFVDRGPDSADDWILEHCAPGDVVVTEDVPLASAAVKLGAVVIEFRGRELHPENIADRVQVRDLVTALREERREQTGGPPPFAPRDRKTFSHTLGRVLDRLAREQSNQGKGS